MACEVLYRSGEVWKLKLTLEELMVLKMNWHRLKGSRNSQANNRLLDEATI